MDLATMPGMGITGLEEIQSFYDRLSDNDASIDSISEVSYSLGDYWKMIQTDERNREILVDFYNHPKTTIGSLSEKFGITRQRIDQIIAKGTKRIAEAYTNGIIDETITSELSVAAAKKTEINLISIKDSLFSGAGIARLISDIDPAFKVYKGAKINGEWLVYSDDNVSEIIDLIVYDLRYNSYPFKISELLERYPINIDMLMSIKGIIEKEGYVTHEKNKKANGTDRRQIIEDYLDEIGRPATIVELEKNTALTLNQIKGALMDKHIFVNVEKSTYDLANRDYKDATLGELAINLLVAAGQAIKIDHVIKYIKQYKPIDAASIIAELINVDGIYCHDDYCLLADWSLDKIVVKARDKYTVSLEDAILDIFNKSDQNEVLDFEAVAERMEQYGDAVSKNPNSIKGTLARLANKNLIIRVGGDGSGCYAKSSKTIDLDLEKKMELGKFINRNLGKQIEIRYKTQRVNSDKRWRAVTVKGQDARYLYTDHPAGYCIKYLKERIVEYRDGTSNSEEQDTSLLQSPRVIDSISQLKVGHIYSNKDLMSIFKVSGQMGMRRSLKTNSLVLIAKHRPDNPYDDKWDGDVLNYTGMGLRGAQSINYMQNKTLAESETNGVNVYLFESYADNEYFYRGVVELAGKPFYVPEKDEDGTVRTVLKFPIRLKEEQKWA